MFKFEDSGTEVWIDPQRVISVEHNKDVDIHNISVLLEQDVVYTYTPKSDEGCRKFLFDLFKAMGHEYKYEG